MYGAEAFLDMMRAEVQLSPNVFFRMHDVFALRSDAILVRFTYFGTDRDGGAHERGLLSLCTFGGDGLVTRLEHFDDDRVAEALAHFDELTAAPPVERFANAAWRAVEASMRTLERRDWRSEERRVGKECRL